MSQTLKLLKEFPKPTRVGQTERGTYVVYETNKIYENSSARIN